MHSQKIFVKNAFKKPRLFIRQPIFIAAIVVSVGFTAYYIASNDINGTQAGIDPKIVYVSDEGKDTDEGTYTNPVRSITHAIELAEPQKPLVINLIGTPAGFTYGLSYHLVPLDYAQDGNPLLIKEGQNIVLSSMGEPVTVLHDGSNNRLILKKEGLLQIHNLRFFNVGITIGGDGPLNFYDNIHEVQVVNELAPSLVADIPLRVEAGNSTKESNNIVSNNKFNLFLPDRLRRNLIAIQTRVTRKANLTMRKNEFNFPGLPEGGWTSVRYVGISVDRGGQEIRNAKNDIAYNKFQTGNFIGKKSLPGQIGVQVNLTMDGINLYKNNFSKFSGIELVQ